MTKASEIYGQSLYDLAAEEGLSEEIMDQMEAAKGILSDNPDYVTLLLEPSIPRKERLRLLDEAFEDSIHPYLKNFLKILIERGLLREFGGCYRKYRSSYHKDHGITEAAVTAAVPLSETELSRLKEKLEQLSGKKVLMNFRQDENVLGGIRVELEGRLYDGTVKGRLDDLRKKVNETVL